MIKYGKDGWITILIARVYTVYTVYCTDGAKQWYNYIRARLIKSYNMYNI